MPAHGLRFESQYDSDNVTTFIATDVGLTVSVSDEEAVDSTHNETFTCSFEMRAAEAIRLREWLNTLTFYDLKPGDLS